MKKLFAVIAVIILVAVIALCGYKLSQPSAEDLKKEELKVALEIEKANHCEQASDCKIAGFGCPFGCWNYINKSETDRLVQLTKNWFRKNPESSCMYKCATLSEPEMNPICEKNKCVTDRVIEAEPATPAPAPAAE